VLKQHKAMLIEELKTSPIALNTMEANEQHYEVPARFYEIVLGRWLKYSAGFWYQDNNNLTQSEEDMLIITLDRADIGKNMKVLDLGCGWGSFSLYAAELYSDSQFTAVSNSSSQKAFIEQRARERGIENLTVITADINEFNPEDKFDRVVSVEMFEHVRNYEKLFQRIHRWLLPEGKLFVHIFSHKDYAYKFEPENEGDWMARHFFTGGMMPSDDFLFHFAGDFETLNHWRFNGKHYADTLEAWLVRMDKNKEEIMELFEETYGPEAKKFWTYWRIFFMACAETFAYKGGTEWGVSHYLFQKK
jgi:cyclopropane-fatty-acyl-phospholipid synthase